jgi:general stress protein YciG
MPLKHSKPTLAQCKATTASGKLCRAKPHKNGLCFFHSDPQKAAELGRKGGRRNRRTNVAPMQHVAAPESAGDVKRMLAESMAEVRTGKMDPKLGTTLAYIGTSLLKAIEVADIDDRLKKLELTTGLEDPTETVSTGDSASREWERPS